MRAAKNLLLSFSGQLLETVAFYNDRTRLERNLAATVALISGLKNPEVNPVRSFSGSLNTWQGYLWRNVPGSEIADFLRTYTTHPASYKVNSALLADFVQTMMRDNELTQWTVVLIGGGQGGSCNITEEIRIEKAIRANNSQSEDRYSIGRLL